MKKKKDVLAALIGSVIYQVWIQTDMGYRNQQLHRLNKAIRGARNLNRLPCEVATIPGKEIVPLSRQLNSFRDMKDLEGLTSAILNRLQRCGLPPEILEASRTYVTEGLSVSSCPDFVFPQEEVFRLEQQVNRLQGVAVKGLLAHQKQLAKAQKQIATTLRALGYETPKKVRPKKVAE